MPHQTTDPGNGSDTEFVLQTWLGEDKFEDFARVTDADECLR